MNAPCCARFLHTFACHCSFFTDLLCPAMHPVSTDTYRIQPPSPLPCPLCVFRSLLSDVRHIQLSLRALRTSSSHATRHAIAQMTSPVASMRHPVLDPDDAYPDLQCPLPENAADETAAWPVRPAPSTSSLVEIEGEEGADDGEESSPAQHYGLTKVILLHSAVAERFRRTYASYFPHVSAARYRTYTSSPGHLAAVLERIVRVLEEPAGHSLGKDAMGDDGVGDVQPLDPLFVVVRECGADEEAEAAHAAEEVCSGKLSESVGSLDDLI